MNAILVVRIIFLLLGNLSLLGLFKLRPHRLRKIGGRLSFTRNSPSFRGLHNLDGRIIGRLYNTEQGRTISTIIFLLKCLGTGLKLSMVVKSSLLLLVGIRSTHNILMLLFSDLGVMFLYLRLQLRNSINVSSVEDAIVVLLVNRPHLIL